jgi:ribosomal protein S18 acetylase RimI-like enzyme/phenylpyruvate tautomerase PptA (4-oxalocrotonate tautomerase family)
MPLIQIDLQPLSDQQRSELRSRVVTAVSSAIGSPPQYVSVVIRESAPANLVEAGGLGPYDSRENVAVSRLILRPAADKDVPVLRVIATAAYEGYVPRIGQAPAPMTADYAQAVRSGHTWVAAGHGEVVGFVILIPQPGHLLLENVAVLPAAQGRGVGSRLLALAEDQAHRLGLGEVQLYTNEAMTENLAYYPRHGYTQTGRAEQDGFRRVFFRKRLTG